MLFNNYLNLLVCKKKNIYIFFYKYVYFFLVNICKSFNKQIKSYNLFFYLSLNSFNVLFIYKFLLNFFLFFNFKLNKFIIYLPKKIIKYTLIKSPFIFKKGRDQFELIIEKIKLFFQLDYFLNDFFINYLLSNLQLNYISIKVKKKICLK